MIRLTSSSRVYQNYIKVVVSMIEGMFLGRRYVGIPEKQHSLENFNCMLNEQSDHIEFNIRIL